MFVEGLFLFYFFGCIFPVSKSQREVFSVAFQHNCPSKGCKMLPELELSVQRCRVSLSSALGHRYSRSNQERMHDTQHSRGNVGFLGNGAGGDHKLPGIRKKKKVFSGGEWVGRWSDAVPFMTVWGTLGPPLLLRALDPTCPTLLTWCTWFIDVMLWILALYTPPFITDSRLPCCWTFWLPLYGSYSHNVIRIIMMSSPQLACSLAFRNFSAFCCLSWP